MLQSDILLPAPLAQIVRQVRRQFQQPLYRNGYALIVNSVAGAALGLLYWLLAARLYPTQVVGLNSALVTAMITLASVGHLNLVSALNRFLPAMGDGAQRFILACYALCFVGAPVACLIFFLGIHYWSPTLASMSHLPYFMLGFTLITVTWCVFILQDSVLIGLRQATWIPVENVIFSLLKIGLLLHFAKQWPHYGIFLSWVCAMGLLIPPVNWLIFRRLLPRHRQAQTEQTQTGQAQSGQASIRISDLARYVAGDYFSSLIHSLPFILLPVMIVEQAGADANAYYAIAWTIAYSFYLVSHNMGMSLTAEASAHPAQMAHYKRQTLVHLFQLLVPTVALVLIAAPWIMQIFGAAYASQATLLLRLLVLSALPEALIALSISVARVQRRIGQLFFLQASVCVILLTSAYFLLPPFGITGIGISWLLAQSIVGGWCLVTGEWREQSDVRTEQRFKIRSLSWQHGDTKLSVGHLTYRLGEVRQQWRRRWQQHRLHGFTQQAQSILGQIAQNATDESASHPVILSSCHTWQVQKVFPTVNDVIVAAVGEAGQAAAAVLKLPQRAESLASLEWQASVLQRLHQHPTLKDWVNLVPHVLAAGKVNDQAYILEGMVHGMDSRALLHRPSLRLRIQQNAARLIGDLHRRTAYPVRVDAERLHRWVDQPLQQLSLLNRTAYRQRNFQPCLVRLGSELQRVLAGRLLTVSWVHGDFSPCNLLAAPDGSVTGIVDWELAALDGLPQLDIVMLILATRMYVQRCELGSVVDQLLRADAWQAEERGLVEDASCKVAELQGCKVASPCNPAPCTLSLRHLLLLTWLHHVADTLRRSVRYRDHRVWIYSNVDRVLKSL